MKPDVHDTALPGGNAVGAQREAEGDGEAEGEAEGAAEAEAEGEAEVAAEARPEPPARGRMHTLGGLLAFGLQALAAGREGSRLDAELLLAQCAGCARSTVIAFPERPVPGAAAARFRDAIARRARGVPFAQITGRREFHCLDLAVTSDTLVPRPETELLVDEALTFLPAHASADVLDLGTGTGAIALAIRHARPAARVTGVDLSPAALEIARANGRALGLEVRWLVSDWFSALAGARYDLIAANPPYVRSDDPLLDRALRFEPRAALDGGADGLDAIRRILAAAPAHLAAGGRLLVEHGSGQSAEVARIAAQSGLVLAAVRTDLAGHDRLAVLCPA